MNTRNLKIFGIILVLIIFILIPVFIKSPYYLDLVIIMMMNAVLAMTFLILLRTGLISMAIAAFWGIGAYASALLATNFGLSFWFCLPAAVIITAIIALILGYPLLKNAGFTFVILTSVIGMLFVVAMGNINTFGGYNGISKIPPPPSIHIPFVSDIAFTLNDKVPYFYLLLFLSIVSILIIQAFYAAWTGRAWKAIGLNPRLAQSIGVDLYRYKLISFVVSSAICGLMGSFYAHYQGFVQPDTFNLFPYTIYIQIYAILGGIGYAIIGPILGSVIMTFFPEFMRISREYGPIFLGVLVIIMIMFLPHGLLSLLERPAVKQFFSKIMKILGSLVPGKSRAGQA
jgi:branched-chain amino acid transport system permease protein